MSGDSVQEGTARYVGIEVALRDEGTVCDMGYGGVEFVARGVGAGSAEKAVIHEEAPSSKEQMRGTAARPSMIRYVGASRRPRAATMIRTVV